MANSQEMGPPSQGAASCKKTRLTTNAMLKKQLDDLMQQLYNLMQQLSERGRENRELMQENRALREQMSKGNK